MQVSTLRSELQQAHGQAVSRNTDSCARAELERRLITLQAEEQVQVGRIKEEEMAIQFELT
eukprot:2167422-Prorocentrum_lima.AAC.1